MVLNEFEYFMFSYVYTQKLSSALPLPHIHTLPLLEELRDVYNRMQIMQYWMTDRRNRVHKFKTYGECTDTWELTESKTFALSVFNGIMEWFYVLIEV